MIPKSVLGTSLILALGAVLGLSGCQRGVFVMITENTIYPDIHKCIFHSTEGMPPGTAYSRTIHPSKGETCEQALWRQW